MYTYEELQAEAMKAWEKMSNYWKERNEREDALHDQEIKGYLFRAVADIARKCGVTESEVWYEVEYWSRDKA